jgi:aspartate/methionine/tyrosine aminotransferase
VAGYIERRGGPRYDGRREIVITCGEGEAIVDALFCLADPGDEVILTDPTYAGMLNRVQLAGAVPRLARMRVVDGEWRLDLEALRAAVSDRTRVMADPSPGCMARDARPDGDRGGSLVRAADDRVARGLGGRTW